jgi:cytochrome c oxidase subunit 2
MKMAQALCVCSFAAFTSWVQVFDSAEPWQFGFQDAASPVMEGIINLHHDLFFFLILVLVFVLWMLSRILIAYHHKNNKTPSKVVHGTTIEIIWTVTPSIILIIVAIPSFALLYSIDEVIEPMITIKILGHQWYWSYEYFDYINGDESEGLAFDSYMVPENLLETGQLRLLEVDNRIVLPIKTHVRLLISAADVLHSWAVPALGIKMDAVPGRLNQTGTFITREGVFYGQCSEICGVNHGFMPIVIEAVSLDKYVSWIAEKLA